MLLKSAKGVRHGLLTFEGGWRKKKPHAKAAKGAKEDG